MATLYIKSGTNKVEATIIICFALLLAIMNAPGVIKDIESSFQIILMFETVFAISLALTGIFPIISGSCYVFLYAVSSSVPMFNKPTGVLYLGMIVVMSLWIAKGWYLFAFIAYVLSHIPALFTANDFLSDYLYYILFEFFCIVIVGSVARIYVLRVAKLNMKLEGLYRLLDEQENRIKIQIISELHDYVAKDLSLISTIAQENCEVFKESSAKGTWDTVANAAQHAGDELRMLISTTKTNFTAADIKDVITEGKHMLQQRRIRLRESYDFEDFNFLSESQMKLLVMLLREGMLNIFKYSKPNCSAELQITKNPQNSIFVLMKNTISLESKINKQNSSEFGLRNLNYVFAKEGALLFKENFETTWLLGAELPAIMKHC